MAEDKRFTTDPERIVCCRVCALTGIDKRVAAKSLLGHLGGAHYKQGWTKNQYFERWPGSEADFAIYIPDAKQIATGTANLADSRREREEKHRDALALGLADAPPTTDVVDQLKDKLDPHERLYFDNFCDAVLQDIDRDEVQMPVISSLGLDMVILMRLRHKQLDSTKKRDFAPAKELETAIKASEDRIRKQMDALGISREKKLATKSLIKTTPASLFSGYLDEIERNPPEVLETLRREEQSLFGKMQARIQKMILSVAPDIEAAELEAESIDGPGPVLSLEEALRRANINV